MNSKIKIKGKYTFTIKFNVPLYGTVYLTNNPLNNKITEEGKSFIIRRLYNNVPDPIKYIIISKGTGIDTLKAEGICHETSKTTLKQTSVEFTTSFTNIETDSIQQIGLTNKEKNGIIITHSTLDTPFTKLPDNVTVDINYELILGE